MSTPVEKLSFLQTAVNFFTDGGPFMIFIGLVLFLGLAFAVERFIYLVTAESKNKKDWLKILPYINKGQFKSAMEIASNSKSGVAHMTTYGLTRGSLTDSSGDVQLAMEEGMMEILPKLEARTNYIATFANVATLLGLLGTIFGLIKAFSAVASADPAQKADLLSASISVAMNTTAFGLIAAIPLLLLYSFLQAKTSRIVDSLEIANVKMANAYAHVKKLSKSVNP